MNWGSKRAYLMITVLTASLFATILYLRLTEVPDFYREVDLKGRNVGCFDKFKIKKQANGTYRIQFDVYEAHSGTLRFTDDTVFISFDSVLVAKEYCLFLRHKFRERRDTVLLAGKDEEQVFIANKPTLIRDAIAHVEIRFWREFYWGNASFKLWFSFKDGFIQIVRQDSCDIEVLSLSPVVRYRYIHYNPDLFHI